MSDFDINLFDIKYIEILAFQKSFFSKKEATTIIFTKTVLDGPSKGVYHLQVSLNSFQRTIMNWVRNVKNRERLCGPWHHMRPLYRTTMALHLCDWPDFIYDCEFNFTKKLSFSASNCVRSIMTLTVYNI